MAAVVLNAAMVGGDGDRKRRALADIERMLPALSDEEVEFVRAHAERLAWLRREEIDSDSRELIAD